jgi:hypothetical protein
MNPSVSHLCTLCPPSEFALAHRTDSDFAHPLLSLARQRAQGISHEVLISPIILAFARTYFESLGTPARFARRPNGTSDS